MCFSRKLAWIMTLKFFNFIELLNYLLIFQSKILFNKSDGIHFDL